MPPILLFWKIKAGGVAADKSNNKFSEKQSFSAHQAA
jgi:hypothetical protein